MFGVFDLAAPVAEVGVAEIVGHDEDDVGWVRCGCGEAEHAAEGKERCE